MALWARRRGVRRRAPLPLAAARLTRGTGYGSPAVFPLKDNIPTLRFPAVTVALIVAERGRLLLLAAGRAVAREPDGQHYVCNLVDYAVIPYEVTHPGEQVGKPQGCPAPRRRRG